MTDTVTTKDMGEPFWARVRGALDALRPAARPATPHNDLPAMARALGKRPKPGERIDQELARGWASAAGAHVSLSLLVIEIDRMNDYLTTYGKDAADDCVASVLDAVAATLPRDSDVCLRWGVATFVVVLPDLPVLMARSCATRIQEGVRQLGLEHKESHAGAVTVSMGLAVNNPRGNYDKKLFQSGLEALKKAQRKGLGRLETIDLRPAQESKRLKAAKARARTAA